MKFKFSLPLLMLTFLSSIAQENLELRGSVNARGLVYSQEESPFWMHTNQRGRTDEITNFSGWINAAASYNISGNARLEIGAGALYQDGFSDELQLDESYLSFENSWLQAHVGRKQRKELYRGLSAVNENILWSLNARPLPGISFQTKRPIYFWKDAGLGFKAQYEDFIMDDDRYVENTRLHHKSFHFVFSKIRNFEIVAGLQHFVQWGGTSPQFGELPNGIDDYLRVVTGGGIDADGGIGEQEINGLGNHLGSYEIYINTSIGNYNAQIIYNHLFEDGSGSQLRNTPDGRYGIYLEDKEPGKWVDAMIYEFYYTKHQSRTFPTSDGADNYFNNNLYRSGWTYESRVLGLPFIFLDEQRFRIANNILAAHHVGISGLAFEKLPYKLLTSYRKNYGAKNPGNIPQSNILSTYLDLQVWNRQFDVNVQLGSDFSSKDSPNFGAGIQVSKRFF